MCTQCLDNVSIGLSQGFDWVQTSFCWGLENVHTRFIWGEIGSQKVKIGFG